MFPTRFDNLHDLARLPWFSVQDGELAIDAAVGPSIDVHTHLALSFVMPQNVDLRADTGKTEHYLPADREFAFDRYLNQYLTQEDRTRMERDLVWGNFRKGGMRATHTVGNLAREMRGLAVRRSVLLAIDWPIGSRNALDWLAAVEGRDDLVVFGAVHPLARDVEGKLDRQKALGARGIKIHPAVQLLGPDHPRMIALCRAAGARGLPVFFHCGPVGIEGEGARRRTQVDRYRAALESCPDTTFVLGHAGALQHERAIRFARELPNVWVEVASQGLPVIRQLLDEVDPTRICFGSDWPFYHQAIGLAKVLIATEDRPDLRRMVLHDNAARLLGMQGAYA
ncbi:MAG: amidohydrolase family protein [Myxococcota bacterium]